MLRRAERPQAHVRTWEKEKSPRVDAFRLRYLRDCPDCRRRRRSNHPPYVEGRWDHQKSDKVTVKFCRCFILIEIFRGRSHRTEPSALPPAGLELPVAPSAGGSRAPSGCRRKTRGSPWKRRQCHSAVGSKVTTLMRTHAVCKPLP